MHAWLLHQGLFPAECAFKGQIAWDPSTLLKREGMSHFEDKVIGHSHGML
jgi:hypothetical protein